MKELEFNFTDGKMTLEMHDLSRTFVHWFNSHKIRAQKYEGLAPWLGNAVGNHISPFSFIQTYCETCKEKHGIKYLDRFDDRGKITDKEMSDTETREEVEKFIN